MERRRRALGLKKSPENNAIKSSKQISRITTHGESPKTSSSDENFGRGKAQQKSLPSGCVTPKQKTVIPHSNVTPLKPDSPCSPLQSPGSQMIFLGTLASPEIEVSWDWSCSQVPKDMLPPKITKRVQDVKSQVPVLPTMNMRLRPRLPLQRQITEEENQQRLEYYKNILSLKSDESTSDVLTDPTNNNVEQIHPSASNQFTTPTRPTTTLSKSTLKKDEDNCLFDDSVNEFMFECSQAIEEKLRNGEIDMGPIVDIKISQAKRTHSPDYSNSLKKTCHGRVNLFPENSQSNMDSKITQQNFHRTDRDKLTVESVGGGPVANPPEDKHSRQITSCMNKVNRSISANNAAQKPPANSNCQNSKNRLLLTKPSQTTSNTNNNNREIPLQSKSIERLEKSENISNHNRADMFRKPKNGNSTLLCTKNSNSINLQNASKTIRNQQDVRTGENNKPNEMKAQSSMLSSTLIAKPNTSDITSLLDDEFDMELSSLDVDSLCNNSEKVQLQNECATRPTTKLCTQQEIEAKRLAALQKLMMKKKT